MDKNHATITSLYQQNIIDSMAIRCLFMLLVAVGLLNLIQPAYANENTSLSLKQILLMPGKLTQAHAKLEAQCHKCHVKFNKLNQSPLCLDCHKNIKNDLTTHSGFHSSIDNKKIQECSRCHSEHRGRKADIRALDISRFDHSKTNFPLKGYHQSLVCNECHKKVEKNYRKKNTSCSSCHKDPHQGELKNDCLKCHNQQSWQVRTFDHNSTDFKLTGKHTKVACKSCHTADVSKAIGNQCINCHQAKDKHLTIFGTKCESCHNSRGWNKTNYNHKKETKFALLGKHSSLNCERCHAEKLTPPSKCQGCHQKDDIHAGSNGTECQKCHNNDEWKKTLFNHNNETNFLIVGAHKKLACDACHLPGEIKKLKHNHKNKSKTRQCNDCHKFDDPHAGQLGKNCQQCHQQNSWSKNITFNHELTKFPLTGGHQLLVCQSCHESKSFQIKNFSCNDCHAEDDVHDQVMGSKCGQCHNSASWSAWQFDHQNQTDFPLTGSHKNLTCELCHNKTLAKPIKPPKACFSCHKNDDIHHGDFGRQCERCHTTEKFHEFQH